MTRPNNFAPARVIIIHGNGGSTANDHWFPSVARALRAAGLEVIAETFPDNKLARAKYWLPYIAELGTDENTVIIGHSSGAVAAMRYAEDHPLRGIVLVSPCYTDLGDGTEKASNYYASPWQWDDIRTNCGFIEQFASTDDPYIPVKEPRFIARMLKSKYHEFSDREHFMQAEFPELIKVIGSHLEKTV